jgi:hypothetical protein
MYVKLGALHNTRAEPEEAMRAWEQALLLDPENTAVRANLTSVRETS